MNRASLDLHLFSSSGEHDSLEWVVDVSRPYLEAKAGSTIAYLPLASLYALKMEEETAKAFRGLARIETIDTESMDVPQMEAILRRAVLAYIPGGNTYLLNHRLHLSQLFPSLRKKLENGLPLVAVSAGTVLCGPNILTSNDLNMVPTTYFTGLDIVPFNFNVHYADDVQRDNRLIDYQVFHDNPMLLLEEDAYIAVRGKAARLVRGEAWIWRAGQDKERLPAGKEIPVR